MLSYPNRPFFLRMNKIQKSKSGLFSDFVSVLNYLSLPIQKIMILNNKALILTFLIILYSCTKNEVFLPGFYAKFVFQKRSYIFVNISISAIRQHLDSFQIISLIPVLILIVSNNNLSSFIFFRIRILFIISNLIHQHLPAFFWIQSKSVVLYFTVTWIQLFSHNCSLCVIHHIHIFLPRSNSSDSSLFVQKDFFWFI